MRSSKKILRENAVERKPRKSSLKQSDQKEDCPPEVEEKRSKMDDPPADGELVEKESASRLPEAQETSPGVEAEEVVPSEDPQLLPHGEEYEVEAVREIQEDGPRLNFRIKWKNWDESTNTWEPLRHLKCFEIIMDFLREPEQIDSRDRFLPRIIQHYMHYIVLDNPLLDFEVLFFLHDKSFSLEKAWNTSQTERAKLVRKVQRLNPTDLCSKITSRYESLLKFMERLMERQKYFDELTEWQASIIRQASKGSPIRVENYVDQDPPPKDFVFIDDYIFSPGIEVAKMTVGCTCENCSVENCGLLHNEGVAHYSEKGVLAVPARRKCRRNEQGIFECNSSCACPPDCFNRVTQQGRKVPVTIFKTDNGRGWGLRADGPVRAWSFVMEYLGEVITVEEAANRESDPYLFDLDFNSEMKASFTVDAAEKGNVAHFINHSCNPNLVVIPVWVDVADLQMPRLAFFSNRDIKKNEELSFDYRLMPGDEEEGESSKKNNIIFDCKCGSKNCRTKKARRS